MKRLRYSVSDEQWALIEQGAKVLGVDPKLMMQLCMSIGLRFLDMSIIHPMSSGIAKAVDDRAAQGTATIMADFGRAMAQVPGVEAAGAAVGAGTAAKKESKARKTPGRKK